MPVHPFLEDIELDLDATLDRLIENAEALETIKPHKKEYKVEIEALQNLQESLLSHLVSLDHLMEKKDSLSLHRKKNLREKVMRYSEIDTSILETMGDHLKLDHNQLKIRKNRKTPKEPLPLKERKTNNR